MAVHKILPLLILAVMGVFVFTAVNSKTFNFDPNKKADTLSVLYLPPSATPMCLIDGANCTSNGTPCCQGSCIRNSNLSQYLCNINCDNLCTTEIYASKIYCKGGKQCRYYNASYINCGSNTICPRHNSDMTKCSLVYGVGCFDGIMCTQDSDCRFNEFGGENYECIIMTNPEDNYCRDLTHT